MYKYFSIIPVCRFRGILKFFFFFMFYMFLYVLMFVYMALMVLIGLNGYLNRYASNWTNFQLKWSVLDPNRGIFENWPMGYWGGGPLSEGLRCRQELRP